MQIEAVKQRSWTKSAAICLPSNLSLHTSQSQNIQTDAGLTSQLPFTHPIQIPSSGTKCHR